MLATASLHEGCINFLYQAFALYPKHDLLK